jgi:hypothetical protein
MRRAPLLILILVVGGLVPSGAAVAQSGAPPVLPGAADRPGPQYSLTSLERQQVTEKWARVHLVERLEAEGRTAADIWQILHPGHAATPMGSPDYGVCSMSIWKEPEDQPNWCGPGSGTAVISNWRSISDPAGYMQYLAVSACKPGQTPPDCTGMMTGNTTYVDDWIYITNHEIGTTWYVRYNPSGLADYQAKLRWDIYYEGHPINNVVWTGPLPGWGGYNTPHYVAASAYNIPGNTITYGDTAPNSASPYDDPFGWHTVSLSNFYNNSIATLYNLIAF